MVNIITADVAASKRDDKSAVALVTKAEKKIVQTHLSRLNIPSFMWGDMNLDFYGSKLHLYSELKAQDGVVYS